MDSLQIFACILLIGRLVAVWLYIKILRVQVALLRLPIDPEVWDFRQSLHYMTLVLVVSCMPSIVLDFAVILGVERTTPYLVVYAASNMVSAIFAATIINRMYALAKHTQEVSNLEQRHIESKNKT